jgi:hypothetical protein
VIEDLDEPSSIIVLDITVSGHLTPSSQAWQGMAYTPSKRRRSYAGRFPSA